MQKTKLAIIGSGPSGYTAAIYAARDQLNPVLFEGIKSGGQLMYTSEVENFPGFEEGIRGPELMAVMRKQAERFGTQFESSWITAVDFSARPFKLWTQLPDDVDPLIFDTGSSEEIAQISAKIKQQSHDWEAEAIIISTGAASILLNIPGEKELMGKGVSTCAVCDAAFYKDKITFVAGGGDSAMEDSLALTKFAQSVTIVHRRDSFRASKIMQDRVLNHPKIKILWNSTIKAIEGENKVERVKISTTETAGAISAATFSPTPTEKVYPSDGVFIAIGHKPMTAIFAGQVQLDEQNYVVTRQSVTKLGAEAAQAAVGEKDLIAYPTMTSVAGVFAAGDVVDVRYRQAVTAAGQGCSAALDALKWLENNGQ